MLFGWLNMIVTQWYSVILGDFTIITKPQTLVQITNNHIHKLSVIKILCSLGCESVLDIFGFMKN